MRPKNGWWLGNVWGKDKMENIGMTSWPQVVFLFRFLQDKVLLCVKILFNWLKLKKGWVRAGFAVLENHKGGAKTASYEPQRSLPSRQPRPRPTTASTNSNERPERKMQIICFYLYITSMLLSPFQKSDSTSRILCSQAGLYGIPHYITFLCCFLDTNVIYKTPSSEEKEKRSVPNIEFLKYPARAGNINCSK